MKKMKLLYGFIAVILLFSISTMESNAQIYAGYRDRSDELPGIISDGEMLLIAGGAVVVVGGLVAFLVIKKKQDKKLADAVSSVSDSNLLGLTGISKPENKTIGSLYEEICSAATETPVLVFSRFENIKCQDYNTRQALSVGVRITF